jgi:predicted Fe-S protein YdhL (DUF1289 family)
MIESPCTKICTVDPASGLCLGCGRSLAEIGGWTSYTDAERKRVMAELPKRIETRMRVRDAKAPVRT